MAQIKVVMNGAGSAGIAIAKHLLNMGVKNITMCGTSRHNLSGRREKQPRSGRNCKNYKP